MKAFDMAKYDHGGGCACGLYKECLDDCEHNEYAKNKTENVDIRLMDESRDFSNNTCPASRHAQIIAEALAKAEKYDMLDEDPVHCAGSIASVVSSLYQTRSFLKSLGYDWRIGENQTVEWYQTNDDNGFYEGRARRDNMTNPGNLDYDT
jgi:hypothetical protein